MNTLKAGWAAFQRARNLVSQGTDLAPQSGVWYTHISRAAFVASTMLSTGMLAFSIGIWWILGRPEHLGGAIAFVVSVIALSAVGKLVASALDKDPARPPSDKLFAAWVALTALLGLPLSHLVLYVAPMIQPMTHTPFLGKYLPEVLFLVTIGFCYSRLVIIRLWFERLANEKLKRQAAEQGRALAETRLKLLEAQIEPHFLFNTLASVQHLVRNDAAQADVLLVQLVSYLRQAIPDVRGAASTLGRECELVRTYLDIVRVRMGGRLEVDVQCPPALTEAAFPSLVIHTLVENAIKHGVERQAGPVRIAVRARPAGQCIEVSVEDNGVGRGAAAEGVGLGNLRDRLALAYDGAARLDIADAPGGGVHATVSIPRGDC